MARAARITYPRAAMPSIDHDDVDVLPVPLDRETRERLARFCAETGRPAAVVAAEMLAEVLRDDETAHQYMN